MSLNISWNSLVQFAAIRWCNTCDVISVNKEIYIDIFCRTRDAVRREGSEKWRNMSWFIFHDNAPTHQPVLIKDLLAKNNVTTLDQPSYTPDLAPADFYLLPRTKSTLNERRFCDATETIKNATKELKMLSQNGFGECF